MSNSFLLHPVLLSFAMHIRWHPCVHVGMCAHWHMIAAEGRIWWRRFCWQYLFVKEWHMRVITIFKYGWLIALIAMARNSNNIVWHSWVLWPLIFSSDMRPDFLCLLRILWGLWSRVDTCKLPFSPLLLGCRLLEEGKPFCLVFFVNVALPLFQELEGPYGH
jgi:hypothetical protein